MNFLLKQAGLYLDGEEFQERLRKYQDAYYAFESEIDDEWREYLLPIVLGGWKDSLELLDFVRRGHPIPRPSEPLEIPHLVVVTDKGKWDSVEYQKEIGEILNKL